MDADKKEEKGKTRSPAYPGISLEDAVNKAEQLYEAEDDRFANIEAVAEHWGLSVTNSLFQVAIAALKQYGLLIDEGSKEHRKVKLTELAKDILEHPGDSPRRTELIHRAALTPKIHLELWEKYKGKLPPDVSIRLYLVRERDGARFNKNHVDAFIAQFRSTIAYANLTESDIIPSAENENREDETVRHEITNTPKTPSPIVPAPLAMRLAGPYISFPFSATNTVEIRMNEPLSQADYERFKKLIELSKESLVKSD